MPALRAPDHAFTCGTPRSASATETNACALGEPGAFHAALFSLARGDRAAQLSPGEMMKTQHGGLRKIDSAYRDRDARLRTMDQQGVEKVLMFPTLGVTVEGLMVDALWRDRRVIAELDEVEAESGEHRESVAGAVAAVGGTAAYGVAYERHHLGATEATLPVAGLPAALNGVRIALLTDLHHSALVGADDIRAAVDLTLALRPDLIVLGGDYVSFADRDYMGPVAELLAPLKAPQGVFAVLGNHDDDKNMPAALERHGFEVLKDDRTRVTLRGEALELAGIRFWTRRASEIHERVLRGARDTVLLLAHDPRRLTEGAMLNVPAVLSGHTHGGQVVLPGVGALAKARFPILEGLGRQNKTSIFVSRGIGTVYVPIRINCPPEVAMITLRATPREQPS